MHATRATQYKQYSYAKEKNENLRRTINTVTPLDTEKFTTGQSQTI